jgi:protein-tyrosine-phosphatase
MDDAGLPHPPRATDDEGGESFHLLFVCTGNTCRSPLAEVLARRALDLRGWSHVEVRSAGVAAFPDVPASEGSLQVAHEEGLDLTGHQATPLTPSLIEWADLILTMSPGHLPPIQAAGAGDRATVITDFARREGEGEADVPWGSGVADPVGGSLSRYRSTYRELEELVDRVMARLEPLMDP